jgi:oligopeptide transport system permease protein
MLSYTLRRLLGVVPTFLLIVTAAFFLMRAAPGGPFDAEQTLPPEIEANLQAAYGLDQPVLVQFGRYLAGLLQGDLGPSFRMKDFTVAELIGKGLPVTLSIGMAALALALLIGVPLGLLAALRQNRWVDHAVMTLPVVTLALPFIAYVARLTRGSLLEVLQSGYVRTARAKGLAPSAIVRRHALKPTLLPVVSFLGPAAAALLTGSLVVEQVFGLPGVGRYFVQGAINRDYTLVMGMVVFYAALILLLNLLVDLLYGWLDPRIRHE